ncbi:MAG: DsbA family protein [Sphingomonas sp.]|uniref:thioredoxin domain-containing protein n=1 Tax=Sphingomonas sp. TaxID=28214 RepID=UPI0025D53C28|nr:thioredoxin domain-containing protein [Sphingomonas sp.]MBY0285245.1 DsbA family protein [Sphingomonas sp.]
MKRLAIALIATVVLAVPVVQAAPVKKAAPAKRAAARPDWVHTVVRTPEGGVRMGNPAAKVKLIEYGARTCPTCATFTLNGAPLLTKTYVATGQVSYEYRDFPVHGAIDLAPILLGHCVPTRAFFPLLDAMMANQRALIGRHDQIPQAKQEELQKMSPNAVAAYLGKFFGYTDFTVKAGLPIARANACLADRKAVDAIAAQTAAANKSYTIAGTPTFIVNGVVAEKVLDWAGLEPVLRAAGAK